MRQICRCCLTTNSNIFFDIFEQHKSGTTFAENIRFLAEIQIEHNDGLSQQICASCYDEVDRIYEFCLKVRQADQKLRIKLETAKTQTDVAQMESIQVLDSEFFATVDDNEMQVCVMEEILEQENDQENILIVEEIHDVEEINIVEVLNSVKDQETKIYNEKENLLESLAKVAASQKNVNIADDQNATRDTYLPEDENDEDYLIEFDPNESNNIKAQKWKCGECKLVLRGDVSYEGHMNIHRQYRPHTCEQCQAQYRCRTALKRHKRLKHSLSTKSQQSNDITLLCTICNKSFYSKNNLYLHQAIVHCQGDKCPFQCDDILYGNNLKQHLESIHEKELTETFNSDVHTSPTYQCLKCSEIFEELSLLLDHFKLCQTMEEEILQDDVEINENESIIEMLKLEESEVFEECNVCRKKLLKRNLNKHMEQHKRNKIKVVDDTKPHLCSLCPREFKNSKSLHQHKKIHHGKSNNVTYVCADCERQYASQYLLETHRKQAHKERDNICRICGNAFKLRNQLMNHMKLHLEKNIPCPHCDKKYARQFDLNVHLRSHTGEQPYACHLCDKRFAIKVRLTYHLQKHYGIKHYCKECGAEFNSKQKLKAHSFKHTGMPYRCQMCDDHGFATRNTFKRHLTRVHHISISDEALNEMFQKNTGKNVNIKQIDDHNIVVTASEDDNQDDIELLGKFNAFQNADELDEHLSSEYCQPLYIACLQCNKNFSDLKLLQKHKKEVHKAKCRYICHMCGNLFGGRAQLSAHKRLHKARPFKCDQCDKAYPRRVELEIHMRTHTGELPYECHLCDKRFAIKVRLTYHLQKHEGITHSCTYCSAIYDSRNKLKAHLFKHTGMPYKCELCPGLGFERRLRFANHMKRLHQKVLSEEELTQIFAKNTGKIVHFKNPAS